MSNSIANSKNVYADLWLVFASSVTYRLSISLIIIRMLTHFTCVRYIPKVYAMLPLTFPYSLLLGGCYDYDNTINLL